MCAYHWTVGKLPFYAKDRKMMRKLIETASYDASRLPSSEPGLRALIAALLAPEPQERLGAMASMFNNNSKLRASKANGFMRLSRSSGLMRGSKHATLRSDRGASPMRGSKHSSAERLGNGGASVVVSGGGAEAVKRHPYFAELDWATLALGLLPAPIQPEKRSINAPPPSKIAAKPKGLGEKLRMSALRQSVESRFADWTTVNADTAERDLIEFLERCPEGLVRAEISPR